MSLAAVAPTAALRLRDELRAEILDGVLAPGERLSAASLADRYGTSRTPVREALVLLAREALVQLEPRRGAVVSVFDRADLVDLYEVRSLIEPHAAGRAATRIDQDDLMRLERICDRTESLTGFTPDDLDSHIAANEEFHQIVIDAAQSPRSAAAMSAVVGVPRAFRTAFWLSPEQRGQSLFCHRELLRALSASKAGLAESIMRMHIIGAREFLSEVIDVRA
ncbi:MAG: GntR family transcriptional regulator [Actinomycetota bacterium]